MNLVKVGGRFCC